MPKTVLITGCSTGIGRATAELFVAEGWQVAATMRNPAHAGELAKHPSVAVFALDVTDDASIHAAVAATHARFGALDVLVNNAGFGAFGPFETANAALIDRQLDTNVKGVFNMTRAVLPAMRAQKHGVIINVSSIGGLTTFPMNAIYHATKYAVVGFTEALAYELEPFGIQAKVIAPGGVATDFAGRSLALTFEGTDHPYADSVARVMEAFKARAGSHSEASDIAQSIFGAATDNSRRIRYVVGADAEAVLASRSNQSDEEYVAATKERFGLSPTF
jgi:NAD(P)-dependent dehydrogenase (short-subunit alcohol dehydrogenase family)